MADRPTTVRCGGFQPANRDVDQLVSSRRWRVCRGCPRRSAGGPDSRVCACHSSNSHVSKPDRPGHPPGRGDSGTGHGLPRNPGHGRDSTRPPTNSSSNWTGVRARHEVPRDSGKAINVRLAGQGPRQYGVSLDAGPVEARAMRDSRKTRRRFSSWRSRPV